MIINQKKSQILHIKHHQKKRCETYVYVSEKELAYTDRYEYLGYTIQEFPSQAPNIVVLTPAASKSFERVIYIFKKLKNPGIETNDTPYRRFVTMIANYGPAV